MDMWRCSCRGGYVECQAWMFCFIEHTRLRVDQSESCIVLLYKQEHGTLSCYCTIIPSRAEISRFYPNKYLQVSCLRTYFRVHHTLPYSTILLVPRTTLMVPRTTLLVPRTTLLPLGPHFWSLGPHFWSLGPHFLSLGPHFCPSDHTFAPRTTLLVPRTTLFVLCKRAIGLAQWVWPGNEAVPIMCRNSWRLPTTKWD